MEEANLEAGGVIEVVEMAKGSKMMDAIVTIVGSLDMYMLIVTRNRMTLTMGSCNYASSSKSNEDNERLFVVQHVINSVSKDDIAHLIAHVENVPLSLQDIKVKYLADVFHVPRITKNLISIGQMVEHGLQVRFNPDGCFF